MHILDAIFEWFGSNLIAGLSFVFAFLSLCATLYYGFLSSKLRVNLTKEKEENKQLRKKLEEVQSEREQLLKTPCSELLFILRNLRVIPNAVAELRRLNKQLSEIEDARILREDGAIFPLCVWRNIVLELSKAARLMDTQACEDDPDDEIVKAALELMVTVLQLLVAGHISGASEVIEKLRSFLPKCPAEHILRTARISGLVCKACGVGEASLPGPGTYVHTAACDLFVITLAQLHKASSQNSREWEECISTLIADAMPVLCTNGPSLRRLWTSAWHALVYDSEEYKVIYFTAEMLYLSGPNNAAVDLNQKDRNALIGMVRNTKEIVKEKISTMIDDSRHSRTDLDSALVYCEKAEAALVDTGAMRQARRSRRTRRIP